MKQASIVEGQRYTNGKGAIRKVIRISTPVSVDYKVVKYQLVAKGNARNQNVNEVYGCQLSAFTQWAVEKIVQKPVPWDKRGWHPDGRPRAL